METNKTHAYIWLLVLIGIGCTSHCAANTGHRRGAARDKVLEILDRIRSPMEWDLFHRESDESFLSTLEGAARQLSEFRNSDLRKALVTLVERHRSCWFGHTPKKEVTDRWPKLSTETADEYLSRIAGRTDLDTYKGLVVTRYLFEAPTKFPLDQMLFLGSPNLVMSIGSSYANMMLPFQREKNGETTWVRSDEYDWGDYRPVAEFDFYARKFKRRHRWWSQTPAQRK